MKKPNLLLSCLAYVLLLTSSCKKNEQNQTDPAARAIIEAKDYFEHFVAFTPSSANTKKENDNQKIPVWEKARVVTTKRGQEVIVPLDFAKQLSFTTDFTGAKNYKVQDVYSLRMYKVTPNTYKTEVVSFIPGVANHPSGISLWVNVDDWSGTNILRYLYKDGKKYVNRQNSSTVRLEGESETYCIVRSWYDCAVDEFGQPYDCVFMGNETLGCYEVEKSSEVTCETCVGDIYEQELNWTNIEGNSEEAVGSYGDGIIDDQTGQLTKQASYIWKCGEGSAYVGKKIWNWDYISYETGTLTWKNNALRFNDLEHNSIQIVGLTPPDYNYTVQLGNAIINIAGDQRTASIDLNFVVYQQLGIFGNTSTKSWSRSGHTICKAP